MTDGSVEGGHAGIYGIKRYGPLYVAGIAEYGHFFNETDRRIDWVVDEIARGKYSSDAYGARAEVGWRHGFGPHYVTPFAGLDVLSLHTSGFAEEDAGILGLTFQSERATSLTSSLGVQFDTRLLLHNGQTLNPFARVAWVHEFYPNLGVNSALTLSPEAAFATDALFAAEDAARVTTGATFDLTEHTGLFAYFDGAFADDSQSYAGNGGVKISW
jgi:outer membrane autotransporter protein